MGRSSSTRRRLRVAARSPPGPRPGPGAVTTPAPSWPITNGPGRGHSPSRTCEVRVADPAGGHPDADLAGRRRVQGHLADRERVAGTLQDRRSYHPPSVRPDAGCGRSSWISRLVPPEGPNLYSGDRTRRALDGGQRHPPLERPEPRQPDGVIRTLIADDHAMFRRGIASCLAGEPDFVVAGEAEDGDTAVRVGMAEQPTWPSSTCTSPTATACGS